MFQRRFLLCLYLHMTLREIKDTVLGCMVRDFCRSSFSRAPSKFLLVDFGRLNGTVIRPSGRDPECAPTVLQEPTLIVLSVLPREIVFQSVVCGSTWLPLSA